MSAVKAILQHHKSGDFGMTLDDDEVLEVAAEIERLRDGLDAIRQYGSDTLQGPLRRADDTRDWQRDCVLEMTNRAVHVLKGDPWELTAQKEGSTDGS